MEQQVVLKIDGSSFSATLNFSNGKLISFSIDYNAEGEKFTINGADIVISIGNYHYVPEKKDLLGKFNDIIMEQYKEKIAKINENEAKQFLLELLNYIYKETNGGANELIEKAKNAVKSENVKVEFSPFSSENYTAKSNLIEFEGIDKLRRGALLLIVLVPILIGSELSLLVSLSLSAIGGIIEFILGIVGLLNIRRGFKILDSLGNDVGIGYIGATLYFVSLAIIFIGGILAIVMAYNISAGFDTIMIGGILQFIANILIGIGFYKVGGEYNESLTKMGGILTAIPIIALIGYILVYVGLDKIKSMKSEMPAVQP